MSSNTIQTTPGLNSEQGGTSENLTPGGYEETKTVGRNTVIGLRDGQWYSLKTGKLFGRRKGSKKVKEEVKEVNGG